MNKKSFLTQHAEFCTGSDVVVLVGSSAAKTARVVIGDTPDDQIAASQQRILLIPTGGARGFLLLGGPVWHVHSFDHRITQFGTR